MRPSFQTKLINDPFSDPGLFIPFLFEKRALMFDLGDVTPLSSRDILKVTHVFVTHTHMDHFVGFDTLIRVFLGREKQLHLYGPPGFFGHVEGKLAGYTWNLVHEYLTHFDLNVTEVHENKTLTATYSCKDRFRPQGIPTEAPFSGGLLTEPSFSVKGVLLDHRIPSLGLSLVENFYVNIIKEGLKELRLPVGPWINRFKRSLHENKDLNSDFFVTWEERGITIKEKRFVLGDLADRIARISPGQKITYITDILGSPENLEKAAKIAEKSDHLFIEASFLDVDRNLARRKYHLTAKEAGKLAKKAEVKNITLFHFSPRYMQREDEIRKEALEAFRN